jgi:malonate-semialdehyde dehydrogenase (acetylating)/methylmalonate-semialdehyde dehydrogenase
MAESAAVFVSEPLVRMPSAPLVHDNQVGARRLSAPRVRRISVHSPYTGELLGSVPDSGPEQVAEVVAAALRVSRSWAALPIKERTQPLFRFRELLLSNLDALAHSAARECGKTVAEAAAGVEKGIEVVEYGLSLQNLDGGASLEVSRGVRCELRREPVGVVAGITPFNFPAMVPLWLFPLAVTLGNPFILKPSEKTPLTAAELARLMHEAGYPEGVFSVLHGSAPAVEALIDHPDVHAYGFVGSSKVAASVYTRAAERGKRVLALGGAKNTLILAPDADPALAVQGIVASFTGCAGQRCMAGSVLVAVGPCDGLIERIVKAAGAIQVGAGMGAIIDPASVDRLRAAVDRGIADGARVVLDGRNAPAPSGYEGGSWFAPTVLDHVPPASHCATAELFGPVLSIVRVPSIQAALDFEHASPYGNATSIFTQSGAVARQVSDAATSGMLGVNVGVPVPREPFSFGGTKGSRFGHGDITGQGGVELWTHLKKITSKWGTNTDGSWMS